MENTPETTNPYESQESRVELISTLLEHYDDKIAPVVQEYLQISGITFTDDGLYNEDKQRSALLALNSELSKVNGTMKTLLKENENLIPSVGIIYGKLHQITKLLEEAPDARFSRDELIKKFNGKENIPGGRADYGQTREAVIELRAMFNGLAVAVKLLK